MDSSDLYSDERARLDRYIKINYIIGNDYPIYRDAVIGPVSRGGRPARARSQARLERERFMASLLFSHGVRCCIAISTTVRAIRRQYELC